MRDKSTIKRAVLICLLLHTAIIAVLVLLPLRMGLLQGNPFLAAAVIAASAALVLYTAHTIVRCVYDEIAEREKWLAQISGDMQTMMTTMRAYEAELGRRTEVIMDCDRKLEQRAGMITAYSNRINELVAVLHSIDDGGGQEPDDGTGRKAG